MKYLTLAFLLPPLLAWPLLGILLLGHTCTPVHASAGTDTNGNQEPAAAAAPPQAGKYEILISVPPGCLAVEVEPIFPYS